MHQSTSHLGLEMEEKGSHVRGGLPLPDGSDVPSPRTSVWRPHPGAHNNVSAGSMPQRNPLEVAQLADLLSEAVERKLRQSFKNMEAKLDDVLADTRKLGRDAFQLRLKMEQLNVGTPRETAPTIAVTASASGDQVLPGGALSSMAKSTDVSFAPGVWRGAQTEGAKSIALAPGVESVHHPLMHLRRGGPGGSTGASTRTPNFAEIGATTLRPETRLSGKSVKTVKTVAGRSSTTKPMLSHTPSGRSGLPSEVPRRLSVDEAVVSTRVATASMAKEDLIQAEIFKEWHEQYGPAETGGTGWLHNCVTSKTFDIISLVVIAALTAYLIYEINRAASCRTLDRSLWMRFFEYLFGVLFAVEVALRLYVYRTAFFFNKDQVWNIFDSFLLVVTLIELLILEIYTSIGSQPNMDLNTAFFRVIRVFRVLRIVRVVRFLHDVRLMAIVIVRSTMTFVSSVVLLLLILMIAAMLFVQFMTGWRVTLQEGYEEGESAKWFSSVQEGMLTLFMSCTGGVDWEELHTTLTMTGPWAPSLFTCFIIFFHFSFFNIVTALFVEKALKLGAPEENKQAERVSEKILRDCIHSLATSSDSKLDLDSVGVVTTDDLDMILRAEGFVQYFEMQSRNLVDTENFFKTLCEIEGGSISTKSFIDWCIKVGQGDASRIDVLAVRLEVQFMSDMVNSLWRTFQMKSGVLDLLADDPDTFDADVRRNSLKSDEDASLFTGTDSKPSSPSASRDRFSLGRRRSSQL